MAFYDVNKVLSRNFGSFDGFKSKFNEMALSNFGSGWTWLVQNLDNRTLSIVNTDDAETPLTDPNVKCIVCCDIWEHAYYIMHRNDRAKYMDDFWHCINWAFAKANMLEFLGPESQPLP